MIHDPVWWGTIACTLIFIYNGFIYTISVDRGWNGHYQDMWIGILFLALASNYFYLFIARTYMYINEDIYMGIIHRIHYLPLAWVVFMVALLLGVHKTKEINNKKGGQK